MDDVGLSPIEIEIDFRLAGLLDEIQIEPTDPDIFYAFLRCAYGYGYAHACSEILGEGEPILYNDFGYSSPTGE